MAIRPVHYTPDQYRAKGMSVIDNDGPWCLEGNPHRNFSTSRYWRTTNQTYGNYGIVIHITAGIDDYVLPDTSADSTNAWGSTTSNQASWHVCIDSDSIGPALRDSYRAWHAGVTGYAFNHGTVGVEIGKRTTDWRKAPADWVERTLRNVAIWCAPRVIAWNLPLTVVSNRDEVQRAIVAKRPFGFTQHGWLAPHNRTDAGLVNGTDTFPWEQFLGYVAEEVARIKGSAPSIAYPQIRRHARGWAVRVLQERLNVHGAGISVDGSFGPATEAAVRAFQQAQGIAVDGVVGPDTWGRLHLDKDGKAPEAPKPAPIPAPRPSIRQIDVDGKLGPDTIRRWQEVMGTTVDGKISQPSQLVRAVQRFLNSNGAGLDVDGKGLQTNNRGNYGPTKTIRALQKHLGTHQDGVFSHPTSSAVRALQASLNKQSNGSGRF